MDKTTRTRRIGRAKRTRAKIHGTAVRPRLAVSRSNRNLYLQLIDDDKGVTLAASSSKGLKGSKSERAKEAAKLIAKAAGAKKITTVTFDRGGYRYTGTIALFAEAAREAGLNF